MNEQIKQIAERLAGLRDALEIAPEEIAKVCNLTTEQYLELESGNVDISVSVLHQISRRQRQMCIRDRGRSVPGYRSPEIRRRAYLSEFSSRTGIQPRTERTYAFADQQ